VISATERGNIGSSDPEGPMLAQLLDLVTWRHRDAHCKRNGHQWTDLATPVACSWCGRSRASELVAPAGRSHA